MWEKNFLTLDSEMIYWARHQKRMQQKEKQLHLTSKSVFHASKDTSWESGKQATAWDRVPVNHVPLRGS